MYLVKLKNRDSSYWRNSNGYINYAVVTEREPERDHPNRIFWLDVGLYSDFWWADWQLEFVGILT